MKHRELLGLKPFNVVIKKGSLRLSGWSNIVWWMELDRGNI